MSLGIPKSNFAFLEESYKDVIQEIRNGSSGLPSTKDTIRKTIVFYDFTKLHCTEILADDGIHIKYYWYDWYKSDNSTVIMKFHAHYHKDGTPSSITVFDPYHIQTLTTREHNTYFRELYLILEFIRLRKLSLT